MRLKTTLLCAVAIALPATPAIAAPGDPIQLDENTTLDLKVNARVRYETVDQDNAAGTSDALTIRGRVGAELATQGFALYAEAEGTAALIDDYNDTLPGNGVEPFSVVADPENIELNQLFASYTTEGFKGTLGRQRVIMGNARFVGNVGWRQNEQTFDAGRIQVNTGPFSLDAVYAVSQRTIFGVDSPNEHFDGNFIFLNAGLDLDVVDVTAFSYIVDYDTRLAFSSQTFGLKADASIPLGGASLNLSATYATQSDAGGNPVDYSADFISISAGTSVAGFTLTAGYEELGSDGGTAAFQTPMATLHAYQGWADVFLVTPATGVRDYYGTIKKQFTIPGVSTFTAAVTYHEFEADFGGGSYGSEIDASLGFKLGPVGMLLKYANYNSDGFAVDTEKFWLQAQYAF